MLVLVLAQQLANRFVTRGAGLHADLLVSSVGELGDLARLLHRDQLLGVEVGRA